MRYTIGLIASAGGHLAQLRALEPWWSAHDRFWVSFDLPDAKASLEGERVWWAHHPTNRSLPQLVRNTRLARRVLRQERPDVLVSNGAGVALPFFALGHLLDIPLVFIEVYDRVDLPSLTGRLVAPFVDRVVLQWPQQRQAYPDGVLLETP